MSALRRRVGPTYLTRAVFAFPDRVDVELAEPPLGVPGHERLNAAGTSPGSIGGGSSSMASISRRAARRRRP